MCTTTQIKNSLIMLSFAAIVAGCSTAPEGTTATIETTPTNTTHTIEIIVSGTTPTTTPTTVTPSTLSTQTIVTTPPTQTLVSAPVTQPTATPTTTPIAPAVITPTTQPVVTQQPTTTPTPTQTISVAPATHPSVVAPLTNITHQGIVKDSHTGRGLANVTVTLGDVTTTTDAQGAYTLNQVTASDEAVVRFEKEGYLIGATTIKIKALTENNESTPNYVSYTLTPNNYHWDYASSDEIQGAHIIIDASVAYNDRQGNLYTGTNRAELTYLDITSIEGKNAFTGDFSGINSNGVAVQFSSYGLISLLLKDSSGEALTLAPNETITLRFDATPSLEQQTTLPLWYYDYEQGLWFEEGTAELQQDGTYEGEVSHLGTWSINLPLEEESGIYRGRMVDGNGEAKSHVRVQAIGTNWISRDLTTDEDGFFELEVVPNSSFTLAAYDYENRYGANYTGTIAPIASGDSVED